MREGAARLQGPPRRYMLDGDVYELTGRWSPLLDHLGAELWHLPLLLDLTHREDAEALRCRIGDPDDDLETGDIRRISETLVLLATGQPWWVAQRLLLGAAANMLQIDGDLSREGTDLPAWIEQQPARAVNVIYSWMTKGAEEKEIMKFNNRLFLPPPGALDDDAADELLDQQAEAEGSAFMAAMGQMSRAGAIRPGARSS